MPKTTKSTKTTKKQTAQKKTEEKHQHQTAIVDNTKLELIIDKKQAQTAFNQALKSLGKNVKADGFRQGKVPTSKIEQIISVEKIVNQALNQLLPQAYAELIKKENLIPLTQPEIQIISANKGEDWKLEVQIAQKPEIKLGKYQDSVKKAQKEAQAEIEKQEKELAKAAQEAKTKDDKTKVEIDPSSPKASTVQDKPNLPTTLNDEQKQDIRLRVIFHQLIHDISPEIQELLVKEDVRRQLDDLAHQLKQYNLSFEDYLAKMNLSFDQLTGQMAATSLASLQVEFILAEIIQEQKIEVTDKDFEDYLKKIKSNKKVEDLDGQMKAHLTHTISRRKVIDFLLSIE